MTESILDSTKKILGIEADYKAFDLDIMTHINSIFSILHQMGIGPEDGFRVDDESTVWSDFVDDDRMNSIKTYVYLRVRLLFDPPTTSFHQTALKEQYQELEWRLSTVREGDSWVEPGRLTTF